LYPYAEGLGVMNGVFEALFMTFYHAGNSAFCMVNSKEKPKERGCL
jgi:hypothetical protein